MKLVLYKPFRLSITTKTYVKIQRTIYGLLVIPYNSKRDLWLLKLVRFKDIVNSVPNEFDQHQWLRANYSKKLIWYDSPQWLSWVLTLWLVLPARQLWQLAADALETRRAEPARRWPTDVWRFQTKKNYIV